MDGQLNTTTSSEYSWCIYEIPGHKVGMCRARKYPERPRQQLNKLLNKSPFSRSNDGEYKLLVELHDITRSEALDIEEEWQNKLGYLSDRDKQWIIRQSDEHKAHMSASLKGRKVSDESRAKMSVAATGRKASDETKAKMSASKVGRKLSEEHKAKLSAARKGIVYSKETIEKMAAAQRGKVASDETKAKISAAQKLRQQRKRQGETE